MTKEIEGYLSILENLRGQVKKGLEALNQEGLDWRPIPGKGNLSTLHILPRYFDPEKNPKSA